MFIVGVKYLMLWSYASIVWNHMSIVWSYVSIVSSLHPSLNVNVFAVVLLFGLCFCLFIYLFVCLFCNEQTGVTETSCLHL